MSSEFRLRIKNGCSYFLEQLHTAYGDFLEKTADIKAENKELIKRYGNIWNDLDFELNVAKGMLAVEEFVPEAKADAVREAVESLGSPKGLAAIKEACPEDVTYQDIVLVIAGMENG